MPGRTLNADAALASLSVMSEAQQKDINRVEGDHKALEARVTALHEVVQSQQVSLAKMETSRSSATTMVMTVGVPLFVSALVALIASYVKGIGG